jgi:dTDP-glucose 4,6-dehydratase
VELIDSHKPEYIVNFAALLEPGASWQAPEQWFETNCVALAKLINRLKDRDYIERYMHISTPEVYGSCSGDIREGHPLNPSTPYAAAKAGADFFLRCMNETYNFPLITIRSTNIYGAYQQLYRIIPKSIISLRLGRKIELHGGGKAIKSYIHIRDVSRGELAALLHGKVGNIYHLSPEKGISIRELVRYICDSLGKSFKDNTVDVAERLGQDAVYEINSDLARRELNWKPQMSLREGIKEVIEWVDENWDVFSKAELVYKHKF